MGVFLGVGLRTIFIIHSDLPRHKRVPELATEPTPTRNGLGFCFVFGAWTRADVLITFTIREAKFKFRILKKCLDDDDTRRTNSWTRTHTQKRIRLMVHCWSSSSSSSSWLVGWLMLFRLMFQFRVEEGTKQRRTSVTGTQIRRQWTKLLK